MSQYIASSNNTTSTTAVDTSKRLAHVHNAENATAFEFTRRKRWADLLVCELRDTITLVLSESLHVLYCGDAITDLLGWRNDELVDASLLQFMNTDDRAYFGAAFVHCVWRKSDMLAYGRLQVKFDFCGYTDYSCGPREILFEVRGRPHYLPSTGEFKCCVAMAQIYPSRCTSNINSFLDLKMQNERLEQRVSELRRLSLTLDDTPEFVRTQGGFGILMVNGDSTSSEGVPTEPGVTEEENADHSLKRKHRVCVACGTADSPEWRKGPAGPRTLCNSCGLRWAKKRRTERPTDPEDGSGVL